MSEPAHAWSPPAGPAGPLSPAAPMPRGFELPNDAAAMLDVAVPLAPAPAPAPGSPPQLVVVPPLVDPASRAASPAGVPAIDPAMPGPEALAELEAMPTLQEAPALALAPSPQNAEHDVAHAEAPAPASAPDAWWAPRTALVAATFALAWQLVAFYASQLLPARVAAGLTLDNFDALVGSLPVVGTAVAPLFGAFLGLLALGLVLVGIRRGVREPVLQVAIGAIAAFAASSGILLPRLLA